jgi:hypothetical protein
MKVISQFWFINNYRFLIYYLFVTSNRIESNRITMNYNPIAIGYVQSLKICTGRHASFPIRQIMLPTVISTLPANVRI